jgi:hypothetical protein
VAHAVAADRPDIPLPRRVITVGGAEVDVTHRALVVADLPGDLPEALTVDLTALTGAALAGACTVAIALGRRVVRVRDGDVRAAERVATTMAAILEARAT